MLHNTRIISKYQKRYFKTIQHTMIKSIHLKPVFYLPVTVQRSIPNWQIRRYLTPGKKRVE